MALVGEPRIALCIAKKSTEGTLYRRIADLKKEGDACQLEGIQDQPQPQFLSLEAGAADVDERSVYAYLEWEKKAGGGCRAKLSVREDLPAPTIVIGIDKPTREEAVRHLGRGIELELPLTDSVAVIYNKHSKRGTCYEALWFSGEDFEQRSDGRLTLARDKGRSSYAKQVALHGILPASQLMNVQLDGAMQGGLLASCDWPLEETDIVSVGSKQNLVESFFEGLVGYALGQDEKAEILARISSALDAGISLSDPLDRFRDPGVLEGVKVLVRRALAGDPRRSAQVLAKFFGAASEEPQLRASQPQAPKEMPEEPEERHAEKPSVAQQGFGSDIVGQALRILRRGLGPAIARRFGELGVGIPWPELLREKDRRNNRERADYSDTDVALMLRVLTERMGQLGYPFKDLLGRAGSSHANELIDVRNRWAHQQPFADRDIPRILDTADRLLTSMGANDEANQIRNLYLRLRNRGNGEATRGIPESPQEPVAAKPAPAVVANPPERHTPTPPARETRAVLPAPESPSEDLPAKEPFQISVDYLDTVNYVLAHNRVHFVQRVEISEAREEWRSATVRTSVHAGGRIVSRILERKIDISPEAPTVLENGISPNLDAIEMNSIDRDTRGSLVVEVFDQAGDLLGKETFGLIVRAAGQWTSTPTQLSLELLASYVQPQAACVTALADRVRAELQLPRGSHDIYEDADRLAIDTVVTAAITEASRLKLAHGKAPEGWMEKGTFIRQAEVLCAEKVGTDLDLALFIAAVLENLGVFPLLWIFGEHVIVGYWRTERISDASAETQVEEFWNRVELDELGLLDPRCITVEAPGHSLYDAGADARGELSAVMDRVRHAIVDVARARRSQILPLPSRFVRQDGTVLVSEYSVLESESASAFENSEPEPEYSDDSTPAQVRRWKAALLDLTLRNRLLNYTPSRGVDIAVAEGDLAELENLVNDDQEIRLRPADELDSIALARGTRTANDLDAASVHAMLFEKKSLYVKLDSGPYATRLGRLRKAARGIREETGANNLYLVLGFLKWNLGDRALRSPLILVPVNLEVRGKKYYLRLDDSGISTPNFCLLEKLKLELGIAIPEFADPKDDQSGIDLSATFNAIRHVLAAERIDATVEENASLAILQFAKYQMWRDIDEHWQDLSRNTLVSQMIEDPEGVYLDEASAEEEIGIDELTGMLPIPADATQAEAIQSAVSGKTFVLEGPPGTGKSQTIANLLAYAMRKGKRVLFVAEKRAALEVVQKRLDSAGLGAFALELHDKNSRPNAVRRQLREALEATSDFDQRLYDSSVRERNWQIARLEDYERSLHGTNQAGYSLYDAVDMLAQTSGEEPAFMIPANVIRGLDRARIDQMRSDVEAFAQGRLGTLNHRIEGWDFVKPLANPDADVKELLACGERLMATADSLARYGVDSQRLHWLFSNRIAPRWRRIIDAHPNAQMAYIQMLSSQHAREQASAFVAELRSVASAPELQRALNVLRPEAVAIIPAALEESKRIAALTFRRKRRKAQAEHARQLMNYLVSSSLMERPESVDAAVRDLGAVHGCIHKLREKGKALGLLDKPVTWVPTIQEAETIAKGLEQAIAAATAIASAPGPDFFRWLYTHPQRSKILALIEGFHHDADLFLNKAGYSTVLDPELMAWAGEQPFFTTWMELTRGQDPYAAERALVAQAQYARAMASVRHRGLDQLVDLVDSGILNPHQAVSQFDAALVRAMLEERKLAGELATFTVADHEALINGFADSTQRVREMVPDVLPGIIEVSRDRILGADERRRKTFEREIARQRGGKRIRALFSEMGDLVLALTPCVLMSPSSVSQFLDPTQSLFDIVVFDEASQIRVADAIGAMGRAKSVVVVGDSKQMPPTSFAEVSLGDDEEETEGLDSADDESILSRCIASSVDRQWLSWHYRSQDESLIAFSNSKYYDGRLATFPAPFYRRKAGVGLSLVRIDGRFLRTAKGRQLRTNPEEANAIVDEILARFAASPDDDPSLGVVTFNAQQRNLIEELLAERGTRRIADSLEQPDGLFVKNLENVQGDERDTILFSVAFSKNERGALPLNFGPLSRSGGERRLNVAITRARKEVKLFCSFDPEDMKLETTSSVGLAHLRDYLLAAREYSEVSEPPSSHREPRGYLGEVAAKLREAGLEVKTGVGLSEFKIDLAVSSGKHEGAVVAILLDGHEWANRKSAADRDVLPVSVLKDRMGWKRVLRIWLPQWLKSPDAVVEGILKEVREAEQELTDELPAVETPEPSAPTPQESERKPEFSQTAIVVETEEEQEPKDAEPASASDMVSRGDEQREPENVSDDSLLSLCAVLDEEGIEYRDNRRSGGAFWIRGGQELQDVISKLSEHGADFSFRSRAFTFNQEPGWWLRHFNRAVFDRAFRFGEFIVDAEIIPNEEEADGDASPFDGLTPLEEQEAQYKVLAEEDPFSSWSDHELPESVVSRVKPRREYKSPEDFSGLDFVDTPTKVSQARIGDVMQGILESEGPMPKDFLARRVGWALGIERVSEIRKNQILLALPKDLAIDPEDECVYPRGEVPSEFIGVYRSEPGNSRKQESLGLAEIANAMAIHVGCNQAMDAESLVRNTFMKFFGTRRIGRSIREKANRAIEYGVKTGRLVKLQSGLYKGGWPAENR